LVPLGLGIILVVCVYSAAVYSTQRRELHLMARSLLAGMVLPEEAWGGRLE
jgi:hypothetical protein